MTLPVGAALAGLVLASLLGLLSPGRLAYPLGLAGLALAVACLLYTSDAADE